MNPSISDQLIHKGNIDRSLYSDQHQKMLETMNRQPLQSEDQQSIVCLVQQIGLYKELLAQISYQNQLLARDINFKQQGNMNHQLQSSPMNMNNFMNMPGMDMGGMNMNGMPGLGSSMGGMGNLGNMASMLGGGILFSIQAILVV